MKITIEIEGEKFEVTQYKLTLVKVFYSLKDNEDLQSEMMESVITEIFTPEEFEGYCNLFDL